VANGAPRSRSKRVKVDIEHTLVAPVARGGTLSAADFDQSEWKIIYPCFVEEDLVNPSNCVNRRNV
jgi:hypothetical protein